MDGLYEEEEYPFFDAQDSIGSLDSDDLVPNDFRYDVWAKSPKSVHHRKISFLRSMGLTSDDQEKTVEVDDDDHHVLIEGTDGRITETSGAILRNVVEEEDSSMISSNSGIVSRIQDSNDEEAKIESSPFVQKFADRPIKVADTMARTMSRVKGNFLGNLRSISCILPGERRSDSFKSKAQRVRVRQSKKQSKELSAVFVGQEIQAHRGSILTMKFSLDGRYLASAGEDAVVRVWQVVEDERSNDVDSPDFDTSCLYFTVNDLSELTPLMAAKQKLTKQTSLRKTRNSACVVFPPKAFRILEKPVHEFHGHNGHVLDLSWSKDNFLLSSSVDETVRLWRIGSDQCLKVFPHSNYVTCVQFQPADENYFVSGSIDGKVRIWSVSRCQVVDWIDIREIVTAVAYSPDGKGGVIGSMTGVCRFFSLSDNRLQIEASVSLNSKKNSPCKRIISFQFYPQDPSKVIVACADSHIRILDGVNITAKFIGQRNAGSTLCASFTSDGNHIVSASEDSNVSIWNYHNQNGSSFSQQKTVRSYECFSAGASVALPWSGFKVRKNTGNGWELEESLTNSLPPCDFSLSQEYLLEPNSKISATWPEEKLPSFGISSPLCKSRYEFFRSSCRSSYSCHAWGMAIVTAGWDGRIRSFLNYGLPITV